MTRSQFLGSYEKLWEMPAGTLNREMRLEELSGWDSIAVLNTIALMDREFGGKITVGQIATCRTLGDVLDLAGAELSDYPAAVGSCLMHCYLAGIAHYLPERVVTNADRAAQDPGWEAEKLFKKTGIRQRHVVSEGVTVAELGTRAADRLPAGSAIDRGSIAALIVRTQSSDHFLPGNSALRQHRLGLAESCAAFDVTLGCSGYTYGLWLARALITSGSSRKAMSLVRWLG
jgi:hypothetical protein